MSATRGVAITAIGNFLPPTALLVTQILLAQSLGVDGRGTVAAATAPLLLGVALFTLGLPESLTYFVSAGGHGRLTREFVISLTALAGAGLIGMGLIAFFAQQLSAGGKQLAQLMVIAAFALIPALFAAACRGVAYGAHKWWLVAIERTAGAFFQLIAVAVLFAQKALTLTTATLTVAAATFVGALVYVIVPSLWTALRGTTGSSRAPRSVSFLASYAWRIWAGSIAGVILWRLDQVMMTPLAGVAQLGIYVVAVNASNIILLFNSAVGQVMFAIEPGDPNSARVGRAARLTTLVTVLAGLVLCAASPWLVPILFGREFAPSVPVIFVLVIAYCIGIPGSVAGAALSARGHPGLRSLAMVIATVLYVAAMFLLVPAYGALGAAAAMLLATALPANINIFLLQRYCDIPFSEFYRFRVSDLEVFQRAWGWLATRRRAG